MRIEVSMDLSPEDIQWCLTRATRLRVSFGSILSDVACLGIALGEETENAEDAEASRTVFGIPAEPFAGSSMPGCESLPDSHIGSISPDPLPPNC